MDANYVASKQISGSKVQTLNMSWLINCTRAKEGLSARRSSLHSKWRSRPRSPCHATTQDGTRFSPAALTAELPAATHSVMSLWMSVWVARLKLIRKLPALPDEPLLKGKWVHRALVPQSHTVAAALPHSPPTFHQLQTILSSSLELRRVPNCPPHPTLTTASALNR